MGAARKIQSEIDRTLKKVQEGIDVFDEIWSKVYSPETSLNQKEKYEGDLKKEIKKLQRYRDQIKAWLSSSDIKDKSDLLKGRKDIEREMERFKVCEKEMKTKAFSKEGLGQSAKQDPRERARTEIRDWLNTTVDTLNLQVDEFESEVEGLAATKRGKKPPPRLAHFEASITRHRQHVLRLEQMLRLLDNESLSVEEVTEMRDMVDDYLDRNQEDFDEFETPDDIYEPILDQLEGVADTSLAVPSHVAVGPVAARDKEKEKEKDRERAAALAAKAQLAAHGQIRLDEEEKKPAGRTSSVGNASRPTSASVSVPGSGPSPKAQEAHSQGSASAAAPSPKAAVTSPTARSAASAVLLGAPPPPPPPPRQPQPPAPPAATQQQPTASAPQTIQQGFVTTSAAPSPPEGTTSVPSALAAQQSSGWPFPAASGAASEGLSFSAPRGEALPDSKKRFLSQLQQIQANGGAGSLDGLGLAGPSAGPGSAAGGSVPASPQRSGPLFARPGPGHQSMEGSEQPGSAGALSYEPGKGLDGPPASAGLQQSNSQQAGVIGSQQSGAMGSQPSADGFGQQQQQQQPQQQHQRTGDGGAAFAVPPHVNPHASLQLLAACAQRSIPQQQDSAWQTSALRTRAPPGGVPASYPQQKLPILDNPALFEKLDSEALFFSFYYQPGSYQQYLAARELKRQSWRYHKQHGAWFQRHEEPKEATDEYEKGTYVYFDYNIMHDDSQSGWCYRLKQHFTFRYDALEDES